MPHAHDPRIGADDALRLTATIWGSLERRRSVQAVSECTSPIRRSRTVRTRLGARESACRGRDEPSAHVAWSRRGPHDAPLSHRADAFRIVQRRVLHQRKPLLDHRQFPSARGGDSRPRSADAHTLPVHRTPRHEQRWVSDRTRRGVRRGRFSVSLSSPAVALAVLRGKVSSPSMSSGTSNEGASTRLRSTASGASRTSTSWANTRRPRGSSSTSPSTTRSYRRASKKTCGQSTVDRSALTCRADTIVRISTCGA